MDHPAGSESRGVALVLDVSAIWLVILRLPKGVACSSRSLAQRSLGENSLVLWAGDLGPREKVDWILLPGALSVKIRYSRPREDLQPRVEEAMVALVSAAGWGRNLATVARLAEVESVFFRVVRVLVEQREEEANQEAEHLQRRHRARARLRAVLQNHLQGRRLVCLGCLNRGHRSRHGDVGRRT